MVKNDKLRWFLVASTLFCSFLITTNARSQSADKSIKIVDYSFEADESIKIVDYSFEADESWKIVGSCVDDLMGNVGIKIVDYCFEADKSIKIVDYSFEADKTVCITNVDSLSRETLIKLKLVDE